MCTVDRTESYSSQQFVLLVSRLVLAFFSVLHMRVAFEMRAPDLEVAIVAKLLPASNA